MNIDGVLIGLGNPGPEYAHTRHNLGFMLVDSFVAACEAKGGVEPLSGGKGCIETWKCRLPGGGGKLWLAAKPLTYMNRSGEAVIPLLHYYRVPLDKLLVAQDELDLPYGKLRLKFGGGAAGHKGIGSIAEQAGSQDFYRLRLGIGKPAGFDTVSFVLGRLAPEEAAALPRVLEAALEGVLTFARQGYETAQRQINGFLWRPPAPDGGKDAS